MSRQHMNAPNTDFGATRIRAVAIARNVLDQREERCCGSIKRISRRVAIGKRGHVSPVGFQRRNESVGENRALLGGQNIEKRALEAEQSENLAVQGVDSRFWHVNLYAVEGRRSGRC